MIDKSCINTAPLKEYIEKTFGFNSNQFFIRVDKRPSNRFININSEVKEIKVGIFRKVVIQEWVDLDLIRIDDSTYSGDCIAFSVVSNSYLTEKKIFKATFNISEKEWIFEEIGKEKHE